MLPVFLLHCFPQGCCSSIFSQCSMFQKRNEHMSRNTPPPPPVPDFTAPRERDLAWLHRRASRSVLHRWVYLQWILKCHPQAPLASQNIRTSSRDKVLFRDVSKHKCFSRKYKNTFVHELHLVNNT